MSNFEEEDIEQLMFEARAEYNPSPNERWGLSALIATLILRQLPGSRVACGANRHPQPLDYIPPTPQPPLAVFGPDGGFIVTFFADGSWIEADGRHANVSGFIEGSPEAIARLLIDKAGLDPRPISRRAPRAQTPSDLPRLLNPQETFTWRDSYQYPKPPAWPQDAPPSLCRQSPSARIICAPYEQGSCTYSSPRDSRWGTETLRIQRIPIPDPHSTPLPDDIHEGDCLITYGRKLPANEDEFAEPLFWHPQLVIHAEPEGADHQRVWLVRDAHVANEYATGEDLPTLTPETRSRVLTQDERQEVLEHFNLDVFCPQCSARATPIIYGMPAPDFPSYYAVGGCLIDADNPNYICDCGHTWPSPRS